jgi:hypothetical protein
MMKNDQRRYHIGVGGKEILKWILEKMGDWVL